MVGSMRFLTFVDFVLVFFVVGVLGFWYGCHGNLRRKRREAGEDLSIRRWETTDSEVANLVRVGGMTCDGGGGFGRAGRRVTSPDMRAIVCDTERTGYKEGRLDVRTGGSASMPHESCCRYTCGEYHDFFSLSFHFHA